MGFKEAFAKFREKKKEEKEQLKSMERDVRLKRRLEQKMKSPAQKELEFYQREKAKEQLHSTLKKLKEERAKKMKDLANPFNKKQMFMERNDLKDGNFMKSDGGLF